MELQKVDEPQYYLRSGIEQYLVMHKNGQIIPCQDVIGKCFFIATRHFQMVHEMGDYRDYLADDKSWGYARNILFEVQGYTKKIVETDYWVLVCKIVSIL